MWGKKCEEKRDRGGHVCRMHPQRWAHTTTWWVLVNGEQRRRKSRRIWRHDLNAYRKDWPNITEHEHERKTENYGIRRGFYQIARHCRLIQGTVG